MFKLICALGATVIISTPLRVNAQAKLVEKVVQKGNEIVIPYEKYELPNGLTLIVHEDHSDPIVHVDVTYHVGSAREEIGKSGFAHFFEHMMFQGSDNVADEDHFRIITEAGGTLNGTTNRDRTNYFETVPANQLEKMLWLEADRMGFFLDAVTQEKFEVQRATVKNERGQRYDNQPYGLVSEVTSQNLYPYGHPYSWLTIGYIEDLDRIGVDDLKNFFLRWYGPNNAVLTVGGDVNTQQVVAWVEKYFGSIAKGPEVTPAKVPTPILEETRYVSMMDNYAKLPMLRMVYPTTKFYSDDEAALDCLAEIIGQGNNSLLYKNLIKTNKAVSAGAYNYTSELAGEFTINVTPYPGAKLADMEQIIKETFLEFEQRGVNDEDIEKYKNKVEARIVYGLESVAGKVSQLAAFYTFTGSANYISEHLRKKTSITKEDVLRVYNQYIKGKNSVVLSVLTKNNEDNKVSEDNYTIVKDSSLINHVNYEGLVYNKANDNFDRSKMPPSGPAVVVNAPKFWTANMKGGVSLIGTQTQEIPAVNLLLKFKGGEYTESDKNNGIASLFASMMNEDTKNYSAEAFSLELERLGSSISVYSASDHIGVQVRTLSKNIDATLKLLEERLLHSKFTNEDFDRNKKRAIESVKNSLNRPSYIASTVFSRLLYPNNILGLPSSGTESTLSNIQLSDIESYYVNNFSQKELEVIIVGDIAKNTIMDKLQFLDKLPDVDVNLSEEIVKRKNSFLDKNVIYFVDVPNAAQTEFRIGYVTDLKYDALGDYYKSTIMNYPLGGAFNSRLNLYLREEKGWTYGARSYFSGNQYKGEFAFSSGIRADATDSAVTDILKIIEEYRLNGSNDRELEFTKKSISQSEARSYETGFQKAGFLANILKYSLDEGYTKKQMNILNKITLSEINSLSSKLIPNEDNLIILLVGDKASVASQLTEKGYRIIELDKEGNVLNN